MVRAMANEKSRGVARAFALVFLLSCAFNLAALFALKPVRDVGRLDADAREYFDLAGRVLDGTYHFDSRRVLGHVMILATIRSVTGDDLIALQAVVTTIFSLSAAMAYLLARRICASERIAVSVGVLTAVWPLFLFYGRTLYSETTALPVFLGFLASLPQGSRLGPEREVPRWRWGVSGVILAVCMFIRPMYLLFTPFVPLIIWLEEKNPGRATARRIAVLALCCCATVLPWSLYASVRTGTPILLSANGGETLAGGLNPTLVRSGYQVFIAPDGRRTWTGPGKWLGESDTGYLSAQEDALPRPTRDRMLKARTVRWIVGNPGSALYLEGAKLAYMWGIYPLWNGAQQTIMGNVPTLLMLVASVLALIRLRRSWRQLAMLWTLPVFTSVIALISWGSWRFRQPADVGLFTLGALWVWSLVTPGQPVIRAASPDGDQDLGVGAEMVASVAAAAPSEG
jgi:hypothetical protein